jgi:NAD(P)H-dependent FMN reductase
MSSSASSSFKIGVIVCSIRTTRVNHELVDWVTRSLSPKSPTFELTVIDLLDWNLPMFNEPTIPALQSSTNPLIQSWSSLISSMHAFIFVTPQYNWGYPASLKNAIDYLYHEWKGKPAMVVSYGGHGGDKCAAQLTQVLTGLRMPVCAPVCVVYKFQTMLGEDGKITDADSFFAAHAEPLHNSFAELQNLLVNKANSVN